MNYNKFVFINHKNNNIIYHRLYQQTQTIDECILKVWNKYFDKYTINNYNYITLIAVGGYGRQEMYPYSDVDLLILYNNNDNKTLLNHITNDISTFLTQLWDLGLQIGHSVRTIDECLHESQQDITIQTALLEARYLAGSNDLFNQFHTQFFTPTHLNPIAFLEAKQLEMQQRHQKHDNTPYNLEPNCKESPGGLRDLHTLLWVSQAAGLFNKTQFNPWDTLYQQGILSRKELHHLHKAHQFIQLIRFELHTLSKRREDRLVFDWQIPLAHHLGYTERNGQRANERLMQHYYLAAKTILQLNGLLLQALERIILGESEYTLCNINNTININHISYKNIYYEQHTFLHVSDLNIFKDNPLEILNVFHVWAENPYLRDLSADTQRAIWNHRHGLIKHQNTPEFKSNLLRFFKRGTGLTRCFRKMNALNILGNCIPAFKRIIGQMQHDLFHVYTVDQHILMVLRNVRRFAIEHHIHEYPLCSQLMAEFEPKYVLYIAALFHDIAKGRGGDHSHLGEIEVLNFCNNLKLSQSDIELATFLVKHHLTMSTIAQKSDLSNFEIIAKFANIVKTEVYLTALYLLTVADIRGTSPKVWNAWKAKLLEQLYHQTVAYLHQLNDNALIQPNSLPDLAHAAQHRVEQLLLNDVNTKNYHSYPINKLWSNLGLDDSYFLRNMPDDAVWHTQVFLSEQFNNPLNSLSLKVTCRIASDHTGLQVMVYAPDQAELFERLCSCFDNLSLSVLDAKIYTTQKQYALDHFLLAIPDRFMIEETDDLKSLNTLMTHIEDSITHSLTHLPSLSAPRSSRLPRQARHFAFAPHVHLSPDETEPFYLLEVQAVDQASLLYKIAQIFRVHKIIVHTARITTLGGRAEDFFVISGTALNYSKTQLALETDLLNAIKT